MSNSRILTDDANPQPLKSRKVSVQGKKIVRPSEEWQKIGDYQFQVQTIGEFTHENLKFVGIFYCGRMLRGFVTNGKNTLEVSEAILTEDGFYATIHDPSGKINTGYCDFNLKLAANTYVQVKSDKIIGAGMLDGNGELVYGMTEMPGLSRRHGNFKNGRLDGIGVRYDYVTKATMQGLYCQGELINGRILSIDGASTEGPRQNGYCHGYTRVTTTDGFSYWVVFDMGVVHAEMRLNDDGYLFIDKVHLDSNTTEGPESGVPWLLKMLRLCKR